MQRTLTRGSFISTTPEGGQSPKNPKILNGTYSQVGRQTKFDIDTLYTKCGIQTVDDDPHTESPQKEEESGAKTVEARTGKPTPKEHLQHAVQKVINVNRMTKILPEKKGRDETGLALAKSLTERMKQKLAGEEVKVASPESIEPNEIAPKSQRKFPRRSLQSPGPTMPSQGQDGRMVTRFPASHDEAGLGRQKKEQYPPVAWYRSNHNSVLDRPPAWDFHERPKHPSLKRSEEDKIDRAQSAPDVRSPSSPSRVPADMSPEEIDQLTCRERSALGLNLPKKQAPRQPMSVMSGKPELGKVGRVHVVHNVVSCPAPDLLQQDIKGYHKLRYPEWDFVKGINRDFQLKFDETSAPGRYDVRWGSTSTNVKGTQLFDGASGRDMPETNLGKLCPPGAVHAEEKRSPGACVRDRSKAKDSVRLRAVSVADFQNEPERPPLSNFGQTYHDLSDPHACARVLHGDLVYDADSADVYCTRRRDIAPRYDRMLPRGRAAVRGSRFLQDDHAVFGSVGLAFIETTGQREATVEALESRNADGCGRKFKSDIGPAFDHSGVRVTTTNDNNFNHGAEHVCKNLATEKRSPLRKYHSVGAPGRPSQKGFKTRSGVGGPAEWRKSRTHVDLPNWFNEVRDQV